MTEFICPFHTIQETATFDVVADGTRVKASGLNGLGDFSKDCMLTEKLKDLKKDHTVPTAGRLTCYRCSRVVLYNIETPTSQ